jgi:hypothetical protein
VSDTGTERVWFAVQGARSDSELTALDEAGFRKLRESLPMTRVHDWDGLNDALRASRVGREWHHWVLIAMLALLTGEMLMQRRFV